MNVDLYSKVSGQGIPLVVMHGLFGSLENLGAVTRRLEDDFEIHALDLRNHGRSGHAPVMDYPSMAADVVAYLDARGLDQVALLGHSMGGKTAMEVALAHPARVRHLIVADIAPVTYHPRHDAILEGLSAIDPAQLGSRQEAEARLASYVESAGIRQFLLKNLVRGEDSQFRWRLNLPAIQACYSQLAAGPTAEGPFEGPALFIKGADSKYIQEKHQAEVRRLFPNASLRIIPDTGHFLHAEKPEVFTALCRRFLAETP
ncbi:MAG: alpha/beta fold hydrolase [Marinobacter sp.]|nr:alpha/beta fold hydrolase [Marinobacter sp.]